MPAKKKHSKGSFQSKQRRLERRGPAIVQARPPAEDAAPSAASAAPVMQAAVPKQAPGVRAVPAKFNYPNVLSEIRNIGILFAVVMVILVTLSLLLR